MRYNNCCLKRYQEFLTDPLFERVNRNSIINSCPLLLPFSSKRMEMGGLSCKRRGSAQRKGKVRTARRAVPNLRRKAPSRLRQSPPKPQRCQHVGLVSRGREVTGKWPGLYSHRTRPSVSKMSTFPRDCGRTECECMDLFSPTWLSILSKSLQLISPIGENNC